MIKWNFSLFSFCVKSLIHCVLTSSSHDFIRRFAEIQLIDRQILNDSYFLKREARVFRTIFSLSYLKEYQILKSISLTIAFLTCTFNCSRNTYKTCLIKHVFNKHLYKVNELNTILIILSWIKNLRIKKPSPPSFRYAHISVAVWRISY